MKDRLRHCLSVSLINSDVYWFVERETISLATIITQIGQSILFFPIIFTLSGLVLILFKTYQILSIRTQIIIADQQVSLCIFIPHKIYYIWNTCNELYYQGIWNLFVGYHWKPEKKYFKKWLFFKSFFFRDALYIKYIYLIMFLFSMLLFNWIGNLETNILKYASFSKSPFFWEALYINYIYLIMF